MCEFIKWVGESQIGVITEKATANAVGVGIAGINVFNWADQQRANIVGEIRGYHPFSRARGALHRLAGEAVKSLTPSMPGFKEGFTGEYQ